jgi:hypothetical protein
MFDIVEGGNAFDFAIGNSYGVIKKLGIKARNGEIGAFINSSSKNGAAIFFEVFGIISAPTKKANS